MVSGRLCQRIQKAPETGKEQVWALAATQNTVIDNSGQLMHAG